MASGAPFAPLPSPTMSETRPADAQPRTARPALAYWLSDHDRSKTELATFAGVSNSLVSRWCQPWDSPRWVRPGEPAVRKILEFTGGAIGGQHFVRPDLRGAEAGQCRREPLTFTPQPELAGAE